MRVRDIFARLDALSVDEFTLPLKIIDPANNKASFLKKLSEELQAKLVKKVSLVNWTDDFFQDNSGKNLDELFDFLVSANIKDAFIRVDGNLSHQNIEKLKSFKKEKIKITLSLPKHRDLTQASLIKDLSEKSIKQSQPETAHKKKISLKLSPSAYNLLNQYPELASQVLSEFSHVLSKDSNLPKEVKPVTTGVSVTTGFSQSLLSGIISPIPRPHSVNEEQEPIARATTPDPFYRP